MVEIRLGSGHAPAWSSDGERIAFYDNRDGDEEIFVMDADGRHVTQLTHNDVDDGDPTWSPDDRQIAFTRFSIEGPDIYVMNADGAGEVNLTNTSPAFEQEPSWSSTGKIAFVRSVDLWTMNPDGSEQLRLTDTPSLADYGPDWSPDGREIAFTSQEFGGGIFTIRPDGSGLRHLPNTAEGDRFPTWGPLGAQIAFSSQTEAGEDIFRIDADGEARIQLTDTLYSWKPDWRP
ncbi:hypothetical protein ABZ477_02785 [Microbacterium sp. NPDC019599]|uniref:hypothetical protein n=1 Tax=Microbacterium sp. NPDC019599 TaxID=3154690 RepID=UPI003403C06E